MLPGATTARSGQLNSMERRQERACLQDLSQGCVPQLLPQAVHAGVDVHEGDGLGRLALTDAGLMRREMCVLDACLARGVPVAGEPAVSLPLAAWASAEAGSWETRTVGGAMHDWSQTPTWAPSTYIGTRAEATTATSLSWQTDTWRYTVPHWQCGKTTDCDPCFSISASARARWLGQGTLGDLSRACVAPLLPFCCTMWPEVGWCTRQAIRPYPIAALHTAWHSTILINPAGSVCLNLARSAGVCYLLVCTSCTSSTQILPTGTALSQYLKHDR
ncbi:hist_deacetyl domain-containing protein [Haematococcus lacustris]|uniref:Hist_deacetyl domain-containing protein n=1 Tax=Haematococcus lacustris TaxID=44745 RepID=A0A699YIM4_HAELA|nr:hist_deacetyl domain-containing protein [Haematococcus lacustris]